MNYKNNNFKVIFWYTTEKPQGQKMYQICTYKLYIEFMYMPVTFFSDSGVRSIIKISYSLFLWLSCLSL